MNLADKFTSLRIILAPVFLVLYWLPLWFPAWFSGGLVWNVVLLWIVSVVAEFSDLLDGMAARKLNQTSDFGRFFDPFADTLFQLTAFLCFVIDGVFTQFGIVLYLVVIYREFGILFIRNLMLKKGITMGARVSGKAKTATYITAAAIALIYTSLKRLGGFESFQPLVKIAAMAVFCVSVLIAILSFFDYFAVYRAANKVET